MDKHTLILQYFQKRDRLTVQNELYKKHVTALFDWLAQSDEVSNDRTTRLLNLKGNKKARIITREACVVAGLEEVSCFINERIDDKKLTFIAHKSDGDQTALSETIAELSSDITTILAYERTILNILQRMSGIATQTNNIIRRITNYELRITNKKRIISPITHHAQPFIAATRKTPWMQLDKKAVAVGGGLTHRLSLGDGIMVKDNHLALLTTSSRAERSDLYRLLRSFTPRNDDAQLIEIEVETPDQAFQLVSSYHNLQSTIYNQQFIALLFDNFTPEKLKKTIETLYQTYNCSFLIFEASGGIDEGSIEAWSKTGVDILSLGSLTHSPRAVNLSMEFSQ